MLTREEIQKNRDTLQESLWIFDLVKTAVKKFDGKKVSKRLQTELQALFNANTDDVWAVHYSKDDFTGTKLSIWGSNESLHPYNNQLNFYVVPPKSDDVVSYDKFINGYTHFDEYPAKIAKLYNAFAKLDEWTQQESQIENATKALKTEMLEYGLWL